MFIYRIESFTRLATDTSCGSHKPSAVYPIICPYKELIHRCDGNAFYDFANTGQR